MKRVTQRLEKLEEKRRRRHGPTWEEKVQAERRLGALLCKRLNTVVFGLPEPTVADEQQAEQDEALVAEWERRQQHPRPAPAPDLEDRLIRRIEQRIEAGEGPWPVDT